MQNRKISALLQALFPPPGVFPHPALADSRLPEHNRNQRGACTSSVLLPEISLVFERKFGYTFLVCYLVSLRTVLQLNQSFAMLACKSSVLLPEISLVFERKFGYNFLVRYLVSLRTI